MKSRSGVAALAGLVSLSLAQFNNPPGVDIWCGKAYRSGNASFNPGGWFPEPNKSSIPLLDLGIKPRMNLYLDSDTSGAFIVDARVNYLMGEPYPTGEATGGTAEVSKLSVVITSTDNDTAALSRTTVVVGSTDNEISFDLGLFSPRPDPYNISIFGTLPGSQNVTYTASTQLYRLPSRADNGSVTRVDNLYGGLAVKQGASDWAPIFPYTYYVQWSLYWYRNVSTLDTWAAMGYNVIHIVPTGDLADTPFPWAEFEPYLDRAASLGLYLMYDVRWDYTNLTTMIDQVTRLHAHPSLLLWYTGDEPDGKSDPLNSTRIAYDTIRSIDPYHPVSMALNCYNFYYSDYASGAEIILSDVYPIGVNTSWSTVYDTPCNATYGCCGCDDCKGSFEDISDRLDNFAHYDDILGWPKTHWGAPQAFGNETFWTRYPTAAEEVVMNMLSVNHAAKGIVMWDYPTTSDVSNVTQRFAGVLASKTLTKYLIGAPITMSLTVSGGTRIDAAAWITNETMLVSVINLDYGNQAGNITVNLPPGLNVKSVYNKVWGEAQWAVSGNTISAAALLGLEVSLIELRGNTTR